MEFRHPLRLSTGSHVEGSGKGCAMNVISYENGDTEITDYPPCADEALTKIVQFVNDTYCGHIDTEFLFLCSPCSLDVLALAHRTVGTNLAWDHERVNSVYLKIAEELFDATPPDCDNEFMQSAATALSMMQAQCQGAWYFHQVWTYLLWASRQPYDVSEWPAFALRVAHHTIDRFLELTGVTPTPVPEMVTVEAVRRMETTTC